MPGLYDPALVLISKGADVLYVEYDYARPEFQSLPDLEQYQWIAADATAAWRTVSEQRAYERVTLVGKSLGTLPLGHLLTTESQLRGADAIWLTPLLRTDALRRQIASVRHRALFVIGTADHQYDADLLREVERATGGESLVLDGANHGLEVAGKPVESVRMMERIVARIDAFVG